MIEESCVEFSRLLAGKDPVPGGGGAAALTGALGVALGSMAGNLTLGKKRYAAVEGEMLRLLEEAERLRESLLALVEADAGAFEPVMRAYRLPSGSAAER
ncbi:MAG: cyclodeaminase/cyclohydrolase family protein, partial [Spirochaetaceae bacterium]|nr:cyclodeaminase/cyclohydrolase family protein [Spirochaetaceae bacterium]